MTEIYEFVEDKRGVRYEKKDWNGPFDPLVQLAGLEIIGENNGRCVVRRKTYRFSNSIKPSNPT